MLAHAKIKFSNKTIDHLEFETNLASYEFEKLPVCVIGGKRMGQTLACLRGLGTKLGYYSPDNAEAAYYCDVILDMYSSVFNCYLKFDADQAPSSKVVFLDQTDTLLQFY